VIKAGMRDVIMGDHGTGRAARIDGLDYSGKTGTAQFRSGEHTVFQSWIIAYAPSSKPRFAVTITLDMADAAAISVGPKMKRLIEGLLSLPAAEGRGA
jgi:cell division protein FtsI/penicillin-binding protein 2